MVGGPIVASTPSTSVLLRSALATWSTCSLLVALPLWPKSIRGRISSLALPASGTRGLLMIPRRRRARTKPD